MSFNGMRALRSPPEITGKDAMALCNHGLGEVELPVELERARLHGERARCRSGLRRLVENAYLDAELG